MTVFLEQLLSALARQGNLSALRRLHHASRVWPKVGLRAHCQKTRDGMAINNPHLYAILRLKYLTCPSASALFAEVSLAVVITE